MEKLINKKDPLDKPPQTMFAEVVGNSHRMDALDKKVFYLLREPNSQNYYRVTEIHARGENDGVVDNFYFLVYVGGDKKYAKVRQKYGIELRKVVYGENDELISQEQIELKDYKNEFRIRASMDKILEKDNREKELYEAKYNGKNA